MKPNTPNQSFFHPLGDVFVGSVAPVEKRNGIRSITGFWLEVIRALRDVHQALSLAN